MGLLTSSLRGIKFEYSYKKFWSICQEDFFENFFKTFGEEGRPGVLVWLLRYFLNALVNFFIGLQGREFRLNFI
jgi:hypothetical protein